MTTRTRWNSDAQARRLHVVGLALGDLGQPGQRLEQLVWTIVFGR
ncbi:MAG: hypothetical protein U1F26_18150 [Lysobacterales bacterium]